MTKPKMSALVASAIRNLREIRGSTSKEIMNYIKSQYTGSDANIQKQIYTALKRGLEYGILKRDRGYYSLNTDPDMMYKAHTVAPLEQARRGRRGRRKHTEDTLRNSPVENLRKDMTYLYKNTDNQTPSRHQSRSRDRSQTRSRSSSSDKEMIDDQNRDQP
ncbi:uncharacterized protein LOC105429023 [Pogonomyrmex barbatus]|uniref:Uncharacterized protein LOC105429023 n=1 Tax=Pogonomyrmex barbatus TaxID=144034 RepID=A0A8N1S8Q4_9HYME|nr:uncharacterized protein LOC105429023 [Pogonomyrmex barbatus]